MSPSRVLPTTTRDGRKPEQSYAAYCSAFTLKPLRKFAGLEPGPGGPLGLRLPRPKQLPQRRPRRTSAGGRLPRAPPPLPASNRRAPEAGRIGWGEGRSPHAPRTASRRAQRPAGAERRGGGAKPSPRPLFLSSTKPGWGGAAPRAPSSRAPPAAAPPPAPRGRGGAGARARARAP